LGYLPIIKYIQKHLRRASGSKKNIFFIAFPLILAGEKAKTVAQAVSLRIQAWPPALRRLRQPGDHLYPLMEHLVHRAVAGDQQ